MSSDFETYEQDFGTLTAEITNKVGRIPKLSGGKCYYYLAASVTILATAPSPASLAANISGHWC